MRNFLAAAVALRLLASFGLPAPAADIEEGFISLFNGQDLGGWVKRGGSAEYQVADGSIVGKCIPNTPGNTFLCTEKEFGNFILRLQYRFLEPGNSGVQFRSAARPEGDHQRVYGYQYRLPARTQVDVGPGQGAIPERRGGQQDGARSAGAAAMDDPVAGDRATSRPSPFPTNGSSPDSTVTRE